MSEYSELNYSKIVNDLWRFRRLSAGGNNGIQDFDTPGHFYFKILFGFDDNGSDSNGLLGLQNMDFREIEPISMANSPINQNMLPNVESIRDANGSISESYADTAFNFLLLNNELERANLLIQFVKLLSEINTDSPWYWKSISGLDTLLERKMFGKDFKIDEERPKISIKCLADAYDTRIGTLLDLYRAICYSYSQKKEILPANLRKFDMSIYIFHTPVENMHDITSPRMLSGIKHPNTDSELFNKSGDFKSDTYVGVAGKDDLRHFTSSKLIELRNCEIDINSSKSPLGELSNEDGFGLEYVIDIYCDDAYESRYNEFVMRNIGDFISTDLMRGLNDISSDDTTSYGGDVIGSQEKLQTYIDRYKFGIAEEPGKTEKPLKSIKALQDVQNQIEEISSDISRLGPSVVGSAVSSVTRPIESTIRSKLLGNIYGFSLGRLSSMISSPVGAVRDAIQQSQEISESIESNKKIPGSPTFEEKRAQLLSKLNQSRNIFHNI